MSDPQDYDQVARIVFTYPDFMEMVNAQGGWIVGLSPITGIICRQKSMLWLPSLTTMLCEMIYSNDAS